MNEYIKQLRKKIFSYVLQPWFSICVGFWLSGLIVSYWFNIYIFQPQEPLGLSLTGWLASSFLTALCFLLCAKWHILGYILLPLITLMTAAAFYLNKVFDVFISYSVISVIAETDRREASDYMTVVSLGFVLGLLLLSLLTVYIAHRGLAKRIRISYMLWMLGLFALSTGIVALCSQGLTNWYKNRDYVVLGCFSPITDIYLLQKHTREYLRSDKGKVYNMIMELPSMSEEESSCSLEIGDRLTLVLHLGESLRSDHLNFNGYKRETMPLLSKRLDNIVSFPRHYSYGLQTRVSIVGMLTTAEVATRSTQHRPFIDLFNKHGFTTHFLLDIPNWDYDAPMQILASGCQAQTIASQGFESSDYFFEYMVNEFRELVHKNTVKSFIMLHDLGVHHMFQSLPKNKKWLPDTFNAHMPLRDMDALMNAYDNNIREVDIEVDAIIKELEDQVALYIYVADHGIALGEHGKWGRHADETTMMPAFFIWMSDSFIEKYPAIHAALNQNSSKIVSHDHLLHTVLSLGGISSSLQKKELDLTNPEAKEYTPVRNPDKMLELPLILNDTVKID